MQRVKRAKLPHAAQFCDFFISLQGKEVCGAPAILLVHGFGAFGEHYRRNVGPLAAAGFEVFAPTLPGYGRCVSVCMCVCGCVRACFTVCVRERGFMAGVRHV